MSTANCTVRGPYLWGQILPFVLDAIVARFGRLQDTLGDKLIPELMRHWLEPVGLALDHLARMERLGYLDLIDDWVEARNLRNRRVHE